MRLKKVYAIILLVAVLAVSSSIYWFLQRPQQAGVVEVTQQPSEEIIVFETVDGEELTIEDLLSQGKPVVIYFFATWCPTCERDLKALDEVYREEAVRVNVLVVGFDPTETPEQIRGYKESRNYIWPFAEYNKDAIIKYKVVTQSTKIGISKEGEVVFSEGFGALTKDDWKDLFQRLGS